MSTGQWLPLRVLKGCGSLGALALLTMTTSACSAGAPGPPPASAGTVESRAIPTAISEAPLTDQHGKEVTLASLHGKTVMVVPFLTLCSDICPLTTGNLLQVERSLQAAGVADKVEIVELSVDPGRDTTARLAAYAHLTEATWPLVNEPESTLTALDTFFGFNHQIVPQDNPPAIDWMTGQPLTYDVNHSDGYVLIGADGTQRYSTGAAPNFHGTLNPKLHAFLNDQGLAHLAHPQPFSWTPSDALASLGWLLGQSIPLHTG